MRWVWSVMAAACCLGAASPVVACGGLFCSQAPVDQRAERVIFLVEPEGTRMIVQVSYSGDAEDFAWVLPLASVPAATDLGTFPGQAIVALDQLTAPFFFRPAEPECNVPELKLNGGGSDESTPGVTVHLEETIGPYDTAVIEGDDPALLVRWLRDNDYRVTDSMVPSIRWYTSSGMKLLALKLNPNAATNDIEPFRVDLPPGPPSIPIRLTAVAAEPEMSLLVFILADGRWGPSNWSEIEVAPSRIRYGSHATPAETNYLSLVSREANGAGGRAWITELAAPTADLAETVRGSPVSNEDQRKARDALAELLDRRPYLTRLYSIVSPEEMTLDPIFRPAAGPDVQRIVQLERYVEGDDMCSIDDGAEGCDFDVCGAGACVEVAIDQAGLPPLAACDCAADQTARVVSYPSGPWPVVTCQDPSLSFLSPGDRETPDALPLPDPCVDADCGLGTCVSVNLKVTCRCDDGAVAIGWRTGATTGAPRIRCVDPTETVLWSDLVEAPPTPDAGPRDADAGMDAGAAPILVPGGGGCSGCTIIGSGTSGSGSPALLLVLGWLLHRRRR